MAFLAKETEKMPADTESYYMSLSHYYAFTRLRAAGLDADDRRE